MRTQVQFPFEHRKISKVLVVCQPKQNRHGLRGRTPRRVPDAVTTAGSACAGLLGLAEPMRKRHDHDRITDTKRR